MNDSPYIQHINYGIFGLFLGIVLSFSGFSDFSEIHKMFTFQDPRLIFVFFGAIAISILGFAIINSRSGYREKKAKPKFNKNYVFGAVLFGSGWAISGACPSIALIQFGEGKLSALITIFGILTGVWLFRKIASSVFHVDVGICGEDY